VEFVNGQDGPITTQSVSIENILHECWEYFECIQAPLTDYEYSDDDASDNQVEGGGVVNPPANEESTPTTLAGRRNGKDRSKRRRREKRAKEQALSGTQLKQVTRKRIAEASNKQILLDLDAKSDLSVTLPGWIGVRVKDLPKYLFTLDELKKIPGMAYFEWDGRCADSFLFPC
jgi:hypothetical protein